MQLTIVINMSSSRCMRCLCTVLCHDPCVVWLLWRGGAGLLSKVYSVIVISFLPAITRASQPRPRRMEGLLSREPRSKKARQTNALCRARFTEAKFLNLPNKGNTHRSPSGAAPPCTPRHYRRHSPCNRKSKRRD